MKTLLICIITTLRVSSAAILLVTFSECSKENPAACEEWEVRYDGYNIGGCIGFSCAGSRTLQLDLCGDVLKDAKAGNTIILSEDQCCRRTMTFTRFIRKVS